MRRKMMPWHGLKHVPPAHWSGRAAHKTLAPQTQIPNTLALCSPCRSFALCIRSHAPQRIAAAHNNPCSAPPTAPGQALLQSSHMYHDALHRFASHGIVAPDVKVDLPKMMAQKNQAVDGLTSGVEGLFKKNKVQIVEQLLVLLRFPVTGGCFVVDLCIKVDGAHHVGAPAG